MFETLIKYYEKIDIIGPTIGLEHNNSTTFKTKLGAIISTIVFVTCTVIAFMFGQEVYKRKNPNIFVTNVLKSSSEILVKDLEIYFSLYNPDGSKIKNAFEYVRLEASYFVVPQQGFPYADYDNYKIRVFYNGENNDEQQITFNITDKTIISNDLYSTNSSTLRISVKKCDESISKCASDIEQTLNSKFFVIGHNSYFYDLTNYSNPVNKMYLNKPIGISDQLTKTVQVDFVNDYLESDNGWILESVVTHKSIQLKGYTFQYNLVEKSIDNDLLLIQFSSPRLVSKTTRNYMKIQQLFALIGGLVTGITISSKILFQHYLRFSYLLYFYNLNSDDVLEDNLIVFSNEKMKNNKFSSNSNVIKNNFPIVLNKNNEYCMSNCSFQINQNNKLATKNFKMDSIVKKVIQFKNQKNGDKLGELNKKEINNSSQQFFSNNENNISNQGVNTLNLNVVPIALKLCSKDIVNQKTNKRENSISEDIKAENNIVKSISISQQINTYKNQDENTVNITYFKYIISFVLCSSKEKNFLKEVFNKVEQTLDLKTYKSILNKIVK